MTKIYFLFFHRRLAFFRRGRERPLPRCFSLSFKRKKGKKKIPIERGCSQTCSDNAGREEFMQGSIRSGRCFSRPGRKQLASIFVMYYDIRLIPRILLCGDTRIRIDFEFRHRQHHFIVIPVEFLRIVGHRQVLGTADSRYLYVFPLDNQVVT